MGSTNKTAHYELPQFVANDKPSWLGDVNEAMEAIDTGIYGAKSSADGAQQTANNAVAGVQAAGTRMDGIQTQLDTVATQANQTATTVTGHTSAIATNSANINTLNSRMGSTDISAIGDGTVTGAIDAIAGGGGTGAWSLVGSFSDVAIKTFTIPNSYEKLLITAHDSENNFYYIELDKQVIDDLPNNVLIRNAGYYKSASDCGAFSIGKNANGTGIVINSISSAGANVNISGNIYKK